MLLPLALFLLTTDSLRGPPPDACQARCTCIAPPPTADGVRRAEAVIEGVAGTQRPYGLHNRAMLSTVTRVLVAQVWKGSVPDTVHVFSWSGGGDCGFRFRSGVRYLLFLERDTEGRWFTSVCSLSAPSADATQRMSDLGPGRGRAGEPSPP